MEYSQLERDFILRSLALLEQYDNCELTSPTEDTGMVLEKYETTLLLNCLLGLIVLPRERTRRKIPNCSVSTLQDWGLTKNTEIKWGLSRCDVSLPQVVRRMRNSVSHFNIAVLAEERGRGNREIYAVEFRDINPENHIDTFYMKITVQDLRTFVTKLAQALTSK
jgi:hypothetical protein